MLAKRRDGPEVALCTERPSIPHCTPRAARGVDEEFGARGEPSPSSRGSGHSGLLSGPKLPSQVKQAVSAPRRNKDGDLAQPASPQGAGRGYVPSHSGIGKMVEEIEPDEDDQHGRPRKRGAIVSNINFVSL